MSRAKWTLILLGFSAIYCFTMLVVTDELLAFLLPYFATGNFVLSSILLYVNRLIVTSCVAILPAYILVKFKFPSAIPFAFFASIPFIPHDIWASLTLLELVPDYGKVASMPSSIIYHLYSTLVVIFVLPFWVWLFESMWPSNKQKQADA